MQTEIRQTDSDVYNAYLLKMKSEIRETESDFYLEKMKTDMKHKPLSTY